MDMQKRARANAERLRADFFSSLIPNLQQAAQVNTQKISNKINNAPIPSFSSETTSSDSQEETAALIQGDMETNSIRLYIIVQSEIVSFLDELIHMNMASDREGAAEVMLLLGIKAHRELLQAHAELRDKQDEIRELLRSSLEKDELT